ncbi:DUF2971 domain-containing protein [Desulforhopalus sp. IMCC35007]|uniref:DUF2971 domain-containing protein n=1 Tax=Desulforhopalus sp. IMCC35007 TaxID=2569543 RepID=UPI0010AEB0FA|nr:DUF2971 domain-containing protein [Desulforhopalus sp. IMCC35007]TKB06075.1 DUF2971 domain-containing protein [Desulforhopalus sp. IMCC35007]
MIKDITSRLYSDIPQERLYHYTGFTGLLGIVDSNALWASDIRYMNDSAELKHTADLIRTEITQRIAAGHPKPNLLNQFLDWVIHRITNGHMLFASSFRSNGNLLSQWRGYSRLGKGVSLGFDPDYILQCATQQSFQIGKCIYSCEAQQQLICQVIDAVEALAEEHPKDLDSRDPQNDNAYHPIFHMIESDLLRIAAILKHPSFREEEEWRVVSPVITDYVNAAVLFREGASMLVPYIEFNLAPAGNSTITIEHIFLGPTPNITISMNSMTMYLSKHGIQPREGISYCQIPFRAR